MHYNVEANALTRSIRGRY